MPAAFHKSERTFMRLNKIAVSTAFMISLLLMACTPPEVDLTGDVLIVSKDGQNIKLGLIEVNLVVDTSMQSFIQTKLIAAKSSIELIRPKKEILQEEYEQLSAEKDLRYEQFLDNRPSNAYERRYRDAQKRCDDKREEYLNALNHLLSYAKGAFYVEGLPTPLSTTKTDADGKFTLRTKPGRYALVAHSTRKVGDDTEEYDWLVWVKLGRDQATRVVLSNDNLFGTNCTDCIVRSSELAF